MMAAPALPALVTRLTSALRLSPLMAMALTGASLLLVASVVFVIQGLLGGDGLETTTRSEWRAPVYDAETPAAPLTGSDTQILTRPIFVKSRRPAPPTAQDTAPGAADQEVAPSGLVLNGIVKSGRSRRAFVVSQDNPEGQWRRAGETIGSWTIATIGDTTVTLKGGSGSIQLQLYAPAENRGRAPDAPPTARP